VDRRAFVAGSLGLLAAPLAAEAQQAPKVARIGILTINLAANPHLTEVFLQGLRDLGYVEGRNVAIEYRDAGGKVERLPALAAELVALKVDVIMAGSTPLALAAKQATQDPPHRLHWFGRSGCGRARHQPCAAGRQCHGVVLPYPGASRQMSGTAYAGRFGGQPSHCPLAARRRRRTHGAGHAEGSRSRGPGAGRAASIRGGARSRGYRQGLFGHDQGARGRSGCVDNRHVRR
jgi:hypothetical protein